MEWSSDPRRRSPALRTTHIKMRNYTIRLVAKEDGPELARLLTELGHPTTPEDIHAQWHDWTNSGNSAFVASASNGLLGAVTLHTMMVLHRTLPVGRITSLIVDPTSRGNGLGRSLMAAAESALADAGCGLIEITSNLRRTDAHAFYERLGYIHTSVRLAKVLL